MPLTDTGRRILAAMKTQYGDKKGESVFYASVNSGKLKGVEGTTGKKPEHAIKSNRVR